MIDYDALVDAYRRSLTSVLRGFRPGDFSEAFLETWVPDEDDAKSIEGVFEAALASRVPRLALKVGGATVLRVTAARLEAIAARFGAASASRDADALVLDVIIRERNAAEAEVTREPAPAEKREQPQHPRRAAPGPDVPPMSERTAAYDAAIRASGPFTHLSSPAAAPPMPGVPAGASLAGAVRVVAEHQGATLEAWIDPDAAGHVIVAARHHGGEGDVPAVLEALCRTIESLPIREAADHGAARLELALRGRGGLRVVPGIVSPENADPRIAACTVTLRALLAAYVLRAGPIDVKNEFTLPLRPAWAGASPSEREDRVREVLPVIARELGLDDGAILLSTIHGDARVVVAFAPEIAAARRPLLLFEIERALKSRADEGLTVYLEEMADKNRIRRIVLRPGEARG